MMPLPSGDLVAALAMIMIVVCMMILFGIWGLIVGAVWVAWEVH